MILEMVVTRTVPDFESVMDDLEEYRQIMRRNGFKIEKFVVIE